MTQPQHVEPQPTPRPTGRRVWSTILATGGFVLLKAKSVLGLAKLAGLGKFWITALSMAAMIWFEAQRGGWLFGVGFVLLILVHELGHGYAIKRAGLSSGWPVFIPFFGAMISMRERPQSADIEAHIAFGGPLAGTLAALAAAAAYFATGTRLWLGLAYTGFFLNLFNMIPMPPLDGGRVAAAFSRKAWIVGGLLLGGMTVVTMAPQLLLIGFLALTHAFRGRRADVDERPPLTPEQQTAWTVRYFGLCFFLGAALFFTKRLLGS